jgi:hypothetical protein
MSTPRFHPRKRTHVVDKGKRGGVGQHALAFGTVPFSLSLRGFDTWPHGWGRDDHAEGMLAHVILREYIHTYPLHPSRVLSSQPALIPVAKTCKADER